MNQFYISIIFIGIILIIISLAWVLFDRKKSFDYMQAMEDRKKEMEKIIDDAEEMIEEMNKFSDYVIAKIDAKNDELQNNLKATSKYVSYGAEKIADENASAADITEILNVANTVNTENTANIAISNTASTAYSNITNNETTEKNNPNTIPVNYKHKEIFMLAKDGLDCTEIAKRMNMGKGEIQLILEMNR